ncbi:CopG family transcriptional regulator [uncultured Dubosiella sp.]|uniref:CopG family transcriptional regulator n=1 Tax=uncultured Dubosiella sp. TaxID=1937011 RepID=UPI00272EE2E8|nr:CopG family transcriptional regulator [uncultured Dubosiella sp.]
MEKPKKKMGRPTKENPITILKGIKFDKVLLDKAETYAKENEITFSEVVREALQEYLK